MTGWAVFLVAQVRLIVAHRRPYRDSSRKAQFSVNVAQPDVIGGRAVYVLRPLQTRVATRRKIARELPANRILCAALSDHDRQISQAALLAQGTINNFVSRAMRKPFA
jgi:hypothetical protein